MNQTLSVALIFTISGFLFCCNTSKPKKSIEDLRSAYNSESTFAEKYAKFAQAATNEGYDTLAKLFLAVSKSERIHSTNHGKVIDKLGYDSGTAEIGSFEVKSTIENLKAAIKSEAFDMQSVYPGFIRDAEREKVPEIARSFNWAWNGEKTHLRYYRNASEIIGKGNEKDIPFVWYICSGCGNIYTPANVKEKCELCLTKQENFIGYINKTE